MRSLDDSRFYPMCNHGLNKRGSSDKEDLLGMEECQSLFGIYELKIPKDENLECDSEQLKAEMQNLTQDLYSWHSFWNCICLS